MVSLANNISVVEWEDMKFLICDAPNDQNINLYVREFKKHNVTDVVRCCGRVYDGSSIVNADMLLHVLSNLPLSQLNRFSC